ncbi:hypothetical protein NB311A_21211 [Nitrobacter sp. Nb-311A]|nr:hypothetical protein NB311A_21211 [Nitrobacter sp. Nb-311A]
MADPIAVIIPISFADQSAFHLFYVDRFRCVVDRRGRSDINARTGESTAEKHPAEESASYTSGNLAAVGLCFRSGCDERANEEAGRKDRRS